MFSQSSTAAQTIDLETSSFAIFSFWSPFLGQQRCYRSTINDLASLTISFRRLKRLFWLSLQCFHNCQPVAHVTKKVKSPRNEILSSTFLHVGVAGFTIGALRVRISFHFRCFSLPVDLPWEKSGKQIGLCGYSREWRMEHNLELIRACCLCPGGDQSSTGNALICGESMRARSFSGFPASFTW